MKAIITVGVSASGKTSWAETQPAMVVSRDNVRRTILEQRLGRQLHPGELWSKWKFGKNESLVTDVCRNQMCSCAALGQDIIITDTNLNCGRNEQLKSSLEKLGYDVEFKEFPISLEEAWKRDAGRADGVGHIVLAKQYQQWLDYIGRKKYVPDVSLPKTVLCDLDGTAAIMGNRGAFEWDKVDDDTRNDVVYSLCSGLTSKNIPIVFVSGRSDICYDKTLGWLRNNGFFVHDLIMRKDGDCRKDSIVKEEIFFNQIATKYNVMFAIDDRPQVVRMYQEIGVKTVIIGNPWIEF